MSTRARRGISLFEAVAALAIVGVTSVSALAAVGAEMKVAARAKRALEAEALATTRLDWMSLLTDTELQNLADTVRKGKFPAPLDAYSWTASSTPVTAQVGVYDVQVNVAWPAGSYRLRTHLYRRPPLATSGARR